MHRKIQLQRGLLCRFACSIACTGILVATMAATSYAQNLATYSFPDSGTDGDTAGQQGITQPANAIFSSFTRTGVAFNTAGGAFNNRSWPINGGSADPNFYVGFTITANTGYTLDLTDISFRTQRSNTGPATGEVRVSTDNFATFQSFTYSPPTAINSSAWDFSDITSAAAGTVAFRFYGYGGGNVAGTLRFDDVALQGAVNPVTVGPGFLPGDVNQDGHVDTADVVAMTTAFTDLSAYRAANPNLTDDNVLTIFDVNNDGMYNNGDMQGLLDKLLSGNGSVVGVPEPSTVVLGLLGSLGLAVWTRKRALGESA